MNRPLLPPVIVNGVEIAPSAIAAEAQNHPAPPGKPGLAWRAAARALALREVMLQRARALGLEPDPQECAPGQVETPDEALIRQVIEQDIRPAAPDEAALRRAYDAEPGRFRAPDLWQASHILLAAVDAASQAMARALLDELETHPARFADLAARHSACPSRSVGGSLGQFGPGEMVPAFEAALRGLSPGQIAPDPVETRFGLHLIRLDAAAQGAILPYEAVAPRLRLAAEKAAWGRAARDYAERLLDQAEISGLQLRKDQE